MTTRSGLSASLLPAVDSLDAERYIDHLTEDVYLRFGNGDPLRGHDEVRAMLTGHFATIESMRHELLNEFADGDAIVQQLAVSITRVSGESATDVPAVNVLRVRDGKVYDYRVYIDLSQLAAGAEH